MIRQQPGQFFLTEGQLHDVRAQFIRLIAIFSMLLGAMVVISEITRPLADGQPVNSNALLIGILFMVIQGVTLWVLRYRGLRTASIVTVFMLIAFSFGVELTLAEDVNFVFALLAVIAAAALAPTPVFIGTNVLVLGELVYDLFKPMINGGSIEISDFVIEALVVVTMAFVALAVRNLINATQREALTARRSAELLQASAVVGQVTSRLLNLNELLNQSIELIRRRFEFYHAQVFLLNETKDQAVLVASTGEVGKRLLARHHRLAVGSQSVIGQVTLRGEPIIASDADRDSVHARNELLPDTRSELALPILDGDEIIGALDVQSTNAYAFSPDDVQALEITANLLATAIRNARLFEAQSKTSAENERLLRDAQANLLEIERLNQQLTRTSWQEYLGGDKNITGLTLEGNQISEDTMWTPELIQAGQSRQAITTTQHGRPVVAVPVILRGEVIGAIEVEPEDTPQLETVDMVQAVAQRLALSLDNARLFEEAQSTTAQEHYINDIVARYQTVNSVDDLLRITLTELSQTLGAQRGAIRLGRFQSREGNHAQPPA